ncbi:MAG: hypothetical protein LBF69_02800 [Prevotellaceae bacterium]|nr:hypothetical protein [Prevotellaceae bacterium]
MKKNLNILLSTLLLMLAACVEENLPDSNFAIIIDAAHCSVEGSFVQGSPLGTYCKVLIPYSGAKGNESVTVKSEKVNGIEIAQQTAVLASQEGVISAVVTGTPIALEPTFLPVTVTLNSQTYLVGVEIPVASDPNPNGEVVFTIDDTPIMNIYGITERTFTVSPTMTGVVATNVPDDLLIAITQDLEQGSGTITFTPLAAFLSGDVTFTATFGARPEQQKTVSLNVFGNGDGSVDNPYEINTPELLAKTGSSAGLSKAFKLSDDLTLPAWTPAGTAANPFAGTLDGNNKTITLNINAPAGDNVALFAYLGSTAEIKNLTLTGTITARNNVAALAANSESANISNVTSNVVVTGYNNVAALVAGGSGKDAKLLAFGEVLSVINIMAGNQSATEKLGIIPTGTEVTFDPGTTGTSVTYDNTTDDMTVTKPNPNNDGFTPGDIHFTVQLAATGSGANVRSMSRSINVQSMAMYESGTGVDGDPYIVINAAQLRMTMATYPSAHIAFGDDITVTEWETVASFAGHLDGQGHSATGLTAPFVNINTGNIWNIKFINVDIISTTGNLGAVARTNTGYISSVAVVGKLDSSADCLGGIAGENNNGGTIINCYVNAAITSTMSAVGGIVGRINNGSGFANTTNVIKNCTSEGSISIATGKSQVGGILGRKTNANNNTGKPDSIVNCVSKMDITALGTSNMAGGIFGAHQANNTNPPILTIQQCLFTGTVVAGNTVGGIGGVSPEISDCIVTGTGANATTAMLRITSEGSGASGSTGGISSAAKGNVTRCIVANMKIAGATINSKNSAGIVSAQNNGTPVISACIIMNSKLDSPTARAIAGTTTSLSLNNNYRSNVLNSENADFSDNDATTLDGAIASTIDQAWYESIGFDFATVWAWDTATNRPKLQNTGCDPTVKP